LNVVSNDKAKMIIRFFEIFLDYVAFPALTFWMAVNAALWDERFPKDRTRGMVFGAFSLLMLFAFAYENGYKKYFLNGRKTYFYIVHAIPVSLAMAGFLYGLSRAFL